MAQFVSIIVEECPELGGDASFDAREAEVELGKIVADARAACPSVRLDDLTFVRHLSKRLDTTDGFRAGIGRLFSKDLFVACACAQGDRSAIAILERECIKPAENILDRRGVASEIIEEASQNVRERLLVGEARILDYDGKANLASWVRVTVVREGVWLAKRGKRETALSIDLLSMPSTADDPEAAYFKAHYSAEYKAAFEAALMELSSRERALLRQQIVLGMNVDEVGAVYNVHRATAARWIQGARDELLAKTRLQLAIRLKVSRAEIEQIVRMIESQLRVTMSRILRATPTNSDPEE